MARVAVAVLESEARKDSVRRAILTYREALRVDPSYTPAMISLGFCLVDELRLGWAAFPEDARREAQELCAKVALLRPSDYFGRALTAFVECASGNHIHACEIMADVVRDAPESPELLAYYGVLLGYCGRMAEEIRYHRHALSLVRHPPNWIKTNLAFAHMCQDDPQAPEYVEQALAADPQSVRAHLCRVVVAVRGGDITGARSWADRLLTLDPSSAPSAGARRNASATAASSTASPTTCGRPASDRPADRATGSLPRVRCPTSHDTGGRAPPPCLSRPRRIRIDEWQRPSGPQDASGERFAGQNSRTTRASVVGLSVRQTARSLGAA